VLLTPASPTDHPSTLSTVAAAVNRFTKIATIMKLGVPKRADHDL